MIKNRTYTVLLIFLFTLSLKAQEVQGPYFVYYLLKNTTLSKTYDGFCQKNKVVQDSTLHGSLSLSGSKCQPTIDYTPEQNFTGRDTATYEYKEYYTNKIRYWSFVFVVVNSIIEITPDYYIVDKNSSELDINPLNNDDCSMGYQYLKISNISAANQLQVSQPNETTIRFKPNADYIGMAYISYTVCDTFNTCEDGNIVVNVVDQSNLHSDSIRVGTPKNTHVTIPLPQTGYSAYINPKKGYLEFNSDYSVDYKPAIGSTGLDTFAVVSNNIYKYVFVEIYFVKDPSKITVDDVVFTPKDSIVYFNVATNDITKKYSFLLDKNPGKGLLEKIDNAGNFKYTPESGYEGIQSFTYRVCPQGLCEYGEVKILIGNFQPDTRTHYKFSTPKNVPLVFSYHIPIDAYNFSSPEDSVKFYPGFDTILVQDSRNCSPSNIVNGYNLLVYSPPKDFITEPGPPKTFTINYCIPSTGECVEAICEVTIYDENKNCGKQCVADCVWPGDVNLDGEVSMPDFLMMGYSLGNTGSSRTYQSTSNFRALKSNDWSGFIDGTMSNLKHADADGNGKVDCADTMYVSKFYRKQHSLVPVPVYDRGSFPFILNIVDTNLDIGDIAQIEIQLGDSNYPVINLGGFSYELDYNTDVVNEASLGIDFYDNGWATLNSAQMHMYQKPWDGRLESGFVRSNGNKVSGKGGIEIINFIVEDDIRGFRKDDQLFKVPFYFNNIIVVDNNGMAVQLDNQVAYLTLGSKKTTELDPKSLLVFPNPASDLIQIHLNGKSNELLSLSLFSMDGSLIREIKNTDKKHQVLDIQNLPNGLYLLKVETNHGPITKKVEIFR